MRVFIAVELDAAARAALGVWIERLRSSLGPTASALRWTRADQAHLTLHFFADLDGPAVDRLRAALATPLCRAPFDLRTRDLGVFPPSGPPRVLWAGLGDGREALVALHADLTGRLADVPLPSGRPRRKTSEVFLRGPARPFAPHLTLARVREGRWRDTRVLTNAVPGLPQAEIVWRVDRVTLFRSHLSAGPPRHEPLATTVLAGA